MKSALGDYIGTPAQVRILDYVRKNGTGTYNNRRLPALKRLEAHGYIDLSCEPHANCGRPLLLWTATPRKNNGR